MLHPNNHSSILHHYSTKMISITLFALLALFSLPVLSQPLGPESHLPKINLQRMADRLELDEQQLIEIKAIMAAGKETMQPTHEAMQANRASLEKMINSNNPEQKEIQTLAETQGELLTESLLQRAALRQQVNLVLSEDQRIKMQAYKEAHQEMRAARKHRRPQHK